jgi:hypothetical protein
MVVIIGAGPAGLHAAIRLYQCGVKNLLVIDPRAGTYTRAGSLRPAVSRHAEYFTGFLFTPFRHIKDFERQFHQQAVALGIRITNHAFVRLYQHSTHPGIIVKDTNGHEQTIEADYVLDCTGSRRKVVSNVNQLLDNSPLQVEEIATFPVTNNLFAYVKMPIVPEIHLSGEMTYDTSALNPLDFSQSIIKFRALGWQHFQFPRCVLLKVGKNKVASYIQAPDNLRDDQYENWLNCVLTAYTAQPVAAYSHLPPSRKYASKPRLMTFSVHSNLLKEVSFKGENLPTVIALGDAQFDSNYILGTGISLGMLSIEKLVRCIKIFNGNIEAFNATEYMRTVRVIQNMARFDIIQEANHQNTYFYQGLTQARQHFSAAIQVCRDASQKEKMSRVLEEINMHLRQDPKPNFIDPSSYQMDSDMDIEALLQTAPDTASECPVQEFIAHFVKMPIFVIKTNRVEMQTTYRDYIKEDPALEHVLEWWVVGDSERYAHHQIAPNSLMNLVMLVGNKFIREGQAPSLSQRFYDIFKAGPDPALTEEFQRMLTEALSIERTHNMATQPQKENFFKSSESNTPTQTNKTHNPGHH